MIGPIKKGSIQCQDHCYSFKDVPRMMPDFIGRAKEIHDVALNLKNHRVLTLLGLPGIGKS